MTDFDFQRGPVRTPISALSRARLLSRAGLAMAGLLALLAFRGPLGRAAAAATDPENPVVVIARQLGEFYQRAQPEKAYLHLDRPAYGTGETIWFSAYVVDALRHRPDSLSRILYVELLSPQRRLVARRTLRLDAGGRSAGDITLDDTLRAGTYLLRAYTNWMRNSPPELFFQRPLQVWPAAPNQPATVSGAAGAAPGRAAAKTGGAAGSSATSAVDVQFFAEGGQLVAGLPAVVGFKAVGSNGLGAAVGGQLLDAQNKLVTDLSSAHAGMGRVGFVPAAGQRYHARLRLPDGRGLDYPLPAVVASGYVLHVVEVSDAFLVEARYRGPAGTAPAVPGSVSLLVEGRGVVVGLAARPIGTEGEPVGWRVLKSRYPTGIVHFTLFDAQGAPQAERLAFARTGPPALRMQLTPDRAAYAPHDPVRVRVQVLDAAGQPLAGPTAPVHLSVAVAEAGAVALDPSAGTVAAHLLLTSELAGYVENPDYYLQNPTPEISRALDNLLLTQGWRRFVWKQVLAPELPAAPARFAPERELALAGQVTGMGQRGIPNSQLTFIQTKPQRNVLTASTDADGRFRFVGFPGRDTTVVTLQARRTSGGSNVIIRPDLGAPPAAGAFRLPALPTPALAGPALADYLRRSRQQQVQERQNDPEAAARNIVLANVAVTAKKQLVPANDPRRLFSGVMASAVLDFASMPEAQSGIPIVSLLAGRVPGLTISGTAPNQKIQIRNQGAPLFILDGVRVDIDVINTIPSSDVEVVEVFKGAEAAIFGGSGGAIAIYTKRGDRNYRGSASDAPSAGLLTVRLPGYYPAREFYQPRYGAPVLNAPATDPRRLTLYWNPKLTTNAQGQAEFTFFTADGGGNFQLTAEGISLDGEPGRGTATIYVAPK